MKRETDREGKRERRGGGKEGEEERGEEEGGGGRVRGEEKGEEEIETKKTWIPIILFFVLLCT